MLIDLIHSAQKESQEEMVFLIQKFYKLLRKYGRKLGYEDAENDLITDFIELIKTYKFEKLNNTSDGAIVNFLVRSTYRFYLKRLQSNIEKIPGKISIEDLTPAQKNILYAQTAVEDETSISLLLFQCSFTQKEIDILTAIYEKGYSVSELAEILHVSRQNINQIKKRTEKKFKENQRISWKP